VTAGQRPGSPSNNTRRRGTYHNVSVIAGQHVAARRVDRVSQSKGVRKNHLTKVFRDCGQVSLPLTSTGNTML